MIVPAYLRRLLCPAVVSMVCAFEASAQTVTPPAPTNTRASDAYVAGALALDAKDYPAAEKHFARALVLSPGNRDYVTALALAREHHVSDLVQHAGRERLGGHVAEADALLNQARALDPKNSIVAQHAELPQQGGRPAWLLDAPSFAGAIQLAPTASTKSFHERSDVQQAVRTVAGGYGIRPVFEDSVARQSVRLDLDDVSYQEAMPILLRMGHLFSVPLDAHSILVARDTPENRLRLERQMEETIYVPALSTEQMSDLGNVVRNIFDVRQATAENSLGNLVIRAPEETLRAINLTLDDLLDGGSEVLLELKLYSVDITHSRTTGVSLPQQIGAYNVSSQAQALVTANQSLVDQAIAQGLIPATASVLQIAEYLIGSGVATSTLLSNTLGIFGGGITTTGVYATGGATLNFGLTSSDTRALDVIQLRVGDRQAGTFRIGTRYPITTATYTAGVAANTSSLAGVTINGVSASSLLSQYLGSGNLQTVPQVQYEDLGLTLKATPTVSKDAGINLKLDLKIEALAGGAANNIPILANRQLVSDITVNDGETAMVLSNVNLSEARAINGIPGLSELPGFQSATDQTVQADTNQLVLLLTPHVVRRRSNSSAGPRIAFTPARTAGAVPGGPPVD